MLKKRSIFTKNNIYKYGWGMEYKIEFVVCKRNSFSKLKLKYADF